MTPHKSENDQRLPNHPDENQPSFPEFLGIRWFWIFLAFLCILWLQLLFIPEEIPTIHYSTFRTHLKGGHIDRVTVAGTTIRGQLKSPEIFEEIENQRSPSEYFVTYIPSFGDEALLDLLELHDVKVETEPESTYSTWTIIWTVVPFIILIWIGLTFLSRLQSQGQGFFSIGKSRAKLYDESKERTTFEDVAGVKGAKEELVEIVDYLKDPTQVQHLGGTVPKGVLLVGPPGTGKTLLARAVAGEAGVPFYSITGSDFMEMFVGVGAARVRGMFEAAKKRAPSIIFIDELDSIGRRRGAGLGGGHDEREQTLNQLLSEMDGFEANVNVIVMAATNRPDILDSALLRPGRFDRRITIDLPTMQDRIEILNIHARNKPFADDVDLTKIARGMPGSSGADLENLLNEAALLASRKAKTSIEQEDIEKSRDKILMGLERRGLTLTPEECKLVAYHEAGHAILAAVLPMADPLHKVSIIPRARSMGVTQQLPERDKYIYPRTYMMDRLAVMMGGRASEELVFGTVTSGAENDLSQATNLARQMVLNWGMSERFGHRAFGNGHEQVFLGQEIVQGRSYSDKTAYEIDEEIQTILDGSYTYAMNTLEAYRDVLDHLAGALQTHEELSGDEVLQLVKDHSPPVEAYTKTS